MVWKRERVGKIWEFSEERRRVCRVEEVRLVFVEVVSGRKYVG